MPYESTVYRILIASPSDVEEERDMTTRVIQDWNDLNSFNKKIVLLPVRWETHTSPAYGIRPQESINKQIVDNSDLVIGLFWTKIGSHTGVEISGSIEEIRRSARNGKDVMLYFSKRGKDPSEIDIEQLKLLTEFKKEIYKSALVENFSNLVEFRDKLSRQLEMKIRDLQKEKGLENNLIEFSFVDQESGDLLDNNIEIDFTRIDMSDNEINKIVQESSIPNKIKSDFKEAIYSFLVKENNYPVVLGFKNNNSSIYNNVNVELHLETTHTDSISLNLIGSPDRNILNFRHSNPRLNSKNENKIKALFSDGINKNSENNWEITTESFSIMPNKVRPLKPVLLIYPLKTDIIQFKVRLFSENILNPIEKTCTLNVRCNHRVLSKEEIQTISENIPDDDLPF